MKGLKVVTGLLFNMFIAMMLVVVTGVAPLIAAGGVIVGSLIPLTPPDALGMAVEVELWHADIVEEIFKDNEFLKYAFDADDYVLAGKIVHIPQSGGAANVQKNRTVIPAVSVTRTDPDSTYVLDEYTTDPVRIENAEAVEVSYDKRRSVIAENTEGLKEFVGDNMLYNWAVNVPVANVVNTSGSNVTAPAPGASGNRKAFTEIDLKACRDKLNKQGVAKKNRYILLPTEMLSQLETDMGDKFHYKDVVNLPEGTITKLYGFYIMERSEVLINDGFGESVKVPGAAAGAQDCQVGLFWQKNMVERALGEVKMFESADDPNSYGDIYSLLVRAGGKGRRSDGKGVGLIIGTEPA